MATLSVPTPRRAFFDVDQEEEQARLLELAEMLSSPGNRPSSRASSTYTPVPQTPSTTSFLLERRPYKDPGSVSRVTIALAFVFAITVLFVIVVFFGTSPASAPSPLADTIASTYTTPALAPFPLSTKDLYQQCHVYYSPDVKRPMKGHGLGMYLLEGMDDEEEQAAWRQYGLEEVDTGVCERTLTYLLDGDFGLFFHLTAIVQAQALANLSNRTFFIDDSLWDRGRWEDHFEPLPAPACQMPPRERMKACPRGTRHWVLSSQTLHYHFGHTYQEAFSDPRKANVDRRKPQFDLSRQGYRELFKPSATNQRLIQEAEALVTSSATEGTSNGLLPYVGVHLRRGDRHPMQWKHHSDYVPLADFTSLIKQLWTAATGRQGAPPTDQPLVYLATDDPFAGRELAVVSPLWDFRSLANSTLARYASPRPYDQSSFSKLPPAERITLTRGMIVDFALLVRSPAGVVCTLSSNVCKLAAVALGWEKAFGEKKLWRDVDERGAVDWRPTEVL